ncbi:protein of unknown function [Candidatus Promineifilum breve]|uniref:Transposase n=1 Tax=Candidatus Promineifilum breve TaxID=1806508 RepID=A0A170PFP6_9CHLR|nr:protein of unknown function [Candidatus Promineifilum breve]
MRSSPDNNPSQKYRFTFSLHLILDLTGRLFTGRSGQGR